VKKDSRSLTGEDRDEAVGDEERDDEKEKVGDALLGLAFIMCPDRE